MTDLLRLQLDCAIKIEIILDRVTRVEVLSDRDRDDLARASGMAVFLKTTLLKGSTDA